ncbi:MAG: arginine deiminase-related protein [Capsulimonadales bacterium]|nr:arginine deiminase-related protein [Capsulimonadales bacterium]
MSVNAPPTFLMCPPDFFGVEYVINPWMEGQEGSVVSPVAQSQWNGLYELLTGTLGARVHLLAPKPGLPDMVFTANAALVRGAICVPARLRPVERRGEEPHYEEWFRTKGFVLREPPAHTFFEGAGDALFGQEEDGTPLLWCAHGFRSDRAAQRFLGETLDIETVLLRLMDPRFYHLDTCFCPLPGGYLLWFPDAFDRNSVQEVVRRVPADRRHAVSEADAIEFACNAVAVSSTEIVLHQASDPLKAWLRERGWTTRETPLTEFLKSGGSAKCLTLRLDG